MKARRNGKGGDLSEKEKEARRIADEHEAWRRMFYGDLTITQQDQFSRRLYLWARGRKPMGREYWTP